jgi:hypothetical protein
MRATGHESCARTPAPDRGSSARTEASQRNGAKSRGPKTAEGKARSAQNALKHGLRAQKLVLLADEDMAEFQALEEALRAELAPEGALQELLLARVALAAWRMLRADRMEIELLDPHVGLDAWGQPGGLGLALIRDGHGPRAFATLLRYRGAVQAEFWRALRALSALQAETPVPIELTAAAALPLQVPRSRPAEPARTAGCPSPNEPEPGCSPNESEQRRNLHEASGAPEPQRTRAMRGSTRGSGALESKRTRATLESARGPGRWTPNEPENARGSGREGADAARQNRKSGVMLRPQTDRMT